MQRGVALDPRFRGGDEVMFQSKAIEL